MKNELWNIGLSVEKFKEISDAGTRFRVGESVFRTDEPVPELDGEPPYSPSLVLILGEIKVFFPSADKLLDGVVVGNKSLRDVLPSIEWFCEGACH